MINAEILNGRSTGWYAVSAKALLTAHISTCNEEDNSANEEWKIADNLKWYNLLRREGSCNDFYSVSFYGAKLSILTVAHSFTSIRIVGQIEDTRFSSRIVEIQTPARRLKNCFDELLHATVSKIENFSLHNAPLKYSIVARVFPAVSLIFTIFYFF